MKPVVDILEERVSAAMAEIAGCEAAPIVKPTQDAKFGDYQANGVMALARRLKQNPRQMAGQIVERLNISDMCDTPEIAGPGFINFRLRADWLAQRLAESLKDGKRLGVDPLENAPVTVVDFSGPNIAKQMHVGHLRSTIIGDVIARVLEFWYGDPSKIIRQNHVGDWGTQLGMLLRHFNIQETQKRGVHGIGINDWEQFYIEAKKDFDSDPEAANQSREWVVYLQNDKSEYNCQAKVYWEAICNASLNHCQEVYNKLGVKLRSEHIKGESAYNDQLPLVIRSLAEKGLLAESDGAQCVFLEGFKTKDGNPLPLIVKKSDGAYLYATTDLAAVRYRVDELKAERVIYVTDARQKLHFEMIFACARKAGWVGDNVKLEHVPFGSVMGEDGRPFKTRSGENIKLKDLLAEAQSRARVIVDGKNPELPAEQRQQIADAVGIGAVKYADLSSNLVSDYVFSWDKMLAMEGNTAPYMQYAYARIQSIFRKGNIKPDEIIGRGQVFNLAEPDELSLAKQLLRYSEVIEAVARDLRPHLLTSYLFDLAQFFSGFYNNCPVLKANNRSRDSRVMLCYLVAETIKHGLGLLGISTIEQM
jgi:arginyl-tRNA synthetase